jgi:predicted acylesterase/phospholipase RssA
VAGTSAGSILAALVAAGADPEYVEMAVRGLDFKGLLTRPEEPIRHKSFNILCWFIARTKYAKYVPAFTHLGMYSSKTLEEWLESKLKELLPQAENPIRFQDLLIPCYVIATDLRTAKVKVWSPFHTPQDSVSHAVRASSSIPLFFQPVDNRYVDGGILSNLPAFVFAEDSVAQRPLVTRTLAFSLLSEKVETDSLSIESLAGELINALVEGAVDIQHRLQGDVHEIEIPTFNIKATDFDLMDEATTRRLIQSGRDASTKFFEQEQVHIRDKHGAIWICADQEETYTTIVDNLERPVEAIVIVESETDWVWSLFPSLLSWRCAKVPIAVRLKQRDHSPREKQQIQQLEDLGAYVEYEDEIDTRVFLFLGQHTDTSAAIIKDTRDGHGIDAIRYDGAFHERMIDLLKKSIASLINKVPDGNANRPQLQEVNRDAIVMALKNGVPQYRRAILRFEPVRLKNMVSLTQYIREYKYRQIEHMTDLYRQNELTLFEASQVVYANGNRSLVGPPVVERAGQQYILIQGSTRAVYCNNTEREELICLVVDQAAEALPSVGRLPLKGVRVISRQTKTVERYQAYSLQNFRHIERALRPYA